MTACKKKRITRAECEAKKTKEEPTCAPVSFCAGNLFIHFDGTCLTAEPRQYQIPDGTYSTVTFENGCIVGVGTVKAASYTPNACQGSVGEGIQLDGDVPVVSNDPSNLLKVTPSGLAVQPVFRGDGVTVTGAGTATDPYIISLAGGVSSGGVDISTLTPEVIEVTSTPTGRTVSLKPIGEAGRFGNIEINEFGQVLGVDTTDSPITSITATSPLKATRQGDAVNISLEAGKSSALGNASGSRVFAVGSFLTVDGYRVYVDTDGRIAQIARELGAGGNGGSRGSR